MVAALLGGLNPSGVAGKIGGGVVAAFSGADVSEVAGLVVKDVVLSALPLMAVAPLMTLAVKGLGKLFGQDGAAPPMTGFVLLGPGAWTLEEARRAELVPSRAIYAQHGVPEAYWPRTTFQLPIPAQVPFEHAGKVLEANKAWGARLAQIVALNDRHLEGGTAAVVKYLGKPKRMLELLELQILYAKAQGKGTKALKAMLADVEANVAAKAAAKAAGQPAAPQAPQAPQGLEDGARLDVTTFGPGLVPAAPLGSGGALGALAGLTGSPLVSSSSAALTTAAPAAAGIDPGARSSSFPLLALVGLALAALALAAKGPA